MYRGEKPHLTRLAPTWSLGEMAQHAVDFWLSTEDLPMPNNRVTVDAQGHVKLSYNPNEQVPAQKLYDQLKSMLPHLGLHPQHLLPRDFYLQTEIPVAGVGHQAGTCRFGTDSTTSVLDVNCKAHELDNLYVIDTSFFPSIGAVNPALTAMANALRVGDHILARLGAASPELAASRR
jgi:choline dehydrogenase-like flavoprotein